MEGAQIWASAAVLLCAAGAAQAKDESRMELLAYPPPPASVACADGRAAVTRADPLPTIWLVTSDQLPFIAGRTVRAAPPEVDVSFDITADGRPHALKEARPGVPPDISRLGSDAGAVIVGTWRFTQGRPFAGCRLRAVSRFVHVEDASRSMVLEVVGEAPGRSSYDAVNAGPRPTTLAASAVTAFEKDIAAFHRVLSGPNSTCASAGPLEPRIMRFPDASAVDDPPGGRSWAMINYDVSADGRTANATLAGSSGNASYDAQALAAARQSTFSGAARTGCLAVFRHAGPPLAWPAEAPLKQPDGCPDEPKLAVADIGRYFPGPYQGQNVEGWALVRFDVAPSSTVGNVRVVRAEPAEAFGEAGRQAVAASTLMTPSHAEPGCLIAVAFRFPVASRAAAAAPMAQSGVPPSP